jgi:hypothetical protein
VRSQIHSLVVLNAATYSASHEDVAMTFCLRIVQETAPDPRKHMYPPTL